MSDSDESCFEDDLDPEFYDADGNLLPECGMEAGGFCALAG